MLVASPASPGSAVYSADSRNGLQKLGVFCVIVYVFLVFSRLPELLSQRLGSGLYLMPVVMFTSLAVVALNGRMTALITDARLRFFVLFYVWMIVTFPFSTWRGGSMPIMLYMLRMSLICIALVGTLDTVEDCRKAMLAMAIGMVIILFVGFTAMPTDEEQDIRFGLEYGSLANANEFANHLMIGLPLCTVLLIKKSKLFFNHLLYAGLFIGAAALVVKTGSRGGLVIAAGLSIVVFLAASFTGKMKLLLAAGVLAIVAASAMTKEAMDRYATIFSDTGRIEAVQSKASRIELLNASLRITGRHPLTGVGLGNFVVEYNAERYNAGQSGHWEATHNGYTQVSSELGLPGLFLYVSVLFLCARRLLRVRKQTRRIPELAAAHRLSSALLLAYLAYALSSVFTSNVHEFYFPLLTGLSVALTVAAERDLQLFRKKHPVAVSPARHVPAEGMGAASNAVYAGTRLQVQR